MAQMYQTPVETLHDKQQEQKDAQQNAPVTEPAGTAETTPTHVPWHIPTRYIAGTGLFLFALLVLYVSRGVVTLFFFGVVITYLLSPIHRFLTYRLRFPLGLAVTLTHLVLLALIILAPVLLIPQVVASFNALGRIDVDAAVNRVEQSLRAYANDVQTVPLWGQVVRDVTTPIADTLQATQAEGGGAELEIDPQSIFRNAYTPVVGALGALLNFTGSFLGAALTILFVLLVSVRFSLDSHAFRPALLGLFPARYHPEINLLLDRLRLVWVSFFHGQLQLMLLIGVITTIGAMLLGLRAPLALGLLAGLFELIPNLGPVLAAIPAVLVALIFGSSTLPVGNLTFAIIIVVFYVLVQFLENQLIVPRIMGTAVSLHPLVIIFGALVGGSLFGILGVFLATPVIASLRELVRYVYHKVENEPIPAADD